MNNLRAAKEAEQRKNDLVTYLAHDLKTPITSVIGYLTLLRDEPQISEEIRSRYMNIALDKAERLDDLINEFFEITRFNLSHISLEKKQINLSLMLQQLTYEFQPMLAEKNLTCSLCLAIRNADKKEPYLDGLSLVNGQIQGEYGGGLCQLSNLLYWMFLHTPLTVTERHAHGSESIPPINPGEPAGVDAAIAEGWLDLKIKNNTSHTFQLGITFEDDYMTGTVRCESAKCFDYTVYNPSCRYVMRNGQIYQESEVARRCTSLCTGTVTEELLYQNSCIIDYPLPYGTKIENETQFSTAEKI